MNAPHSAPDSPETGDTDTESMYGQAPGPVADDPEDEEDVPELGAEGDLAPGSTSSLDEG